MVKKNPLSLTKSPPQVSPKLRKAFDALAKQHDHHEAIMLETIRREVPAYGAIATPEFESEVRSMISINLAMWNNVLREQRPATAQDLAPVKEYARRRYHQGIPLSSLLHSFRSGTSAVWRDSLHSLEQDSEIMKEVLLNISPYLLEHSDLLGQALSQSYLDEAHLSRRSRDRSLEELCSLALNEPEQQDRFERLAEELKLDPHGRRVALVVEPATGMDADQIYRGFDEFLRTLTCQFELGNEPPHIRRHGKLFIWLPSASGVNPSQQENQMVGRFGILLRQHGDAAKHIGIGLFQSKALGWRTSADQASSALEWGVRHSKGSEKQVHTYSEIVVEDCAITQRFDASYYEGLLASLADEPGLIETLKIWLETPGLTRKLAASELGIHPNTLDYRLRKIERCLGADLSNLSWLARLHVAIRLRDWY